MNKEGSFKPIIIAMGISLFIAFTWGKVPAITNTVHSIFDPTAGALLDLHLTLGMLVLVFLLSLITTLAQKYGTDQESLRELKKEQKVLQEEMKKYKDNPEKLMELQKQSFAFIPKTMKLSMRAFAYTAVPIILFFRWFRDYFESIGDPVFFGFLSWFWFYMIFVMIFSNILRKTMDVV